MSKDFVLKFITDINLCELLEFYKQHGTVAQREIKSKIVDADGKLLVVGSVAVDPLSRCIVGAYLAKPQQLLCAPQVRVYQSMDTLVSVDARGFALTEKMAKFLYEHLKLEGDTYIVGIPNKLIEPIRLRDLGWKRLNRIKRYSLWMPKVISKIVGNFYQFTDVTDDLEATNFDTHVKALVKEIKGRSKTIKVIMTKSVVFITSESSGRLEIGAIRGHLGLSPLKRLLLLLSVSAHFNVRLVVSYCTDDTPTAQYFRFIPCLRTKSLYFSGRSLTEEGTKNLVDFGIEYAEFDTFGIGC